MGAVCSWGSALLKWPTFLCNGGLSLHHSNTRATQRVCTAHVRRINSERERVFKAKRLLLLFTPSAYSLLCSELSSPSFLGADSFYVRVNLNMEPHGDPPSLGVSCDDIIHVTDTRYKGKYQWRCSVVDPCTAKPKQEGTMPNYNRYTSHQPVSSVGCRNVIHVLTYNLDYTMFTSGLNSCYW